MSDPHSNGAIAALAFMEMIQAVWLYLLYREFTRIRREMELRRKYPSIPERSDA